MFTAQAIRPTGASPSQPLAWPVIGTRRVCDMQNHLMVLGRQTAKERVASFLLLLLDRIGFEEDDILMYR